MDNSVIEVCKPLPYTPGVNGSLQFMMDFAMKNNLAILTYIDKLTSSKMSKQRLKYVIKIYKR